MRENKKFKINFFDIVIAAVVICVAAGVYIFTNREVVQETKPLRYTIEITDQPEGFSRLVSEGDKIYDNIKNYYMGKVVSVEAVPYKKLCDDYVNGGQKDSVIPERETALITLEANVTESGANFRVDGNYTVKAGLEIAVKGNGYAGEGYIVTVER